MDWWRCICSGPSHPSTDEIMTALQNMVECTPTQCFDEMFPLNPSTGSTGSMLPIMILPLFFLLLLLYRPPSVFSIGYDHTVMKHEWEQKEKEDITIAGNESFLHVWHSRLRCIMTSSASSRPSRERMFMYTLAYSILVISFYFMLLEEKTPT